MHKLLLIIILVAAFACETPQAVTNQIEWLQLPTQGNSGLPYLENGLDDVMRCSWVETSGDTATLKFSEFVNEQWSSPEAVATGTDWFVNWADYPKVSASENTMIAHYLQKSAPDTYTYDVKAKIRIGSGWSNPFKVHSDTTKTEHGFVSIIPMVDDQFRLFWLDGRNTTGAHAGAMTLRTALIDEKGNISDRTLLDNRVCDCCSTSAASTKNGPIVAYRDRSDEEIRDIYISQLQQGSWSAPIAANNDFWEIAGCPVNGPSLDVLGNRVALAWFTGGQNKPRVQLAISTDSDQQFERPIVVDDKEPFGRVATKILGDDRVAVLWLARNGEKAQIKLKIINDIGVALKEIVIAETSGTRASGFPQLAVKDDHVYFAHTQPETEGLRVRVGRMKYR